MRHHFLRRCLCRDTKATAAVEAAILAPVLLVVLMLFMDVSKAYREKTQIIAAVAAGAQFAYIAAQASITPASVISETTSEIVAASNSLLTATNVSLSVNNNLVNASTTAPQLANYWAQRCCLSGGSGSPVNYFCSSSLIVCLDGADPGLYLTLSVVMPFSPYIAGDTLMTGKALTNQIVLRVQ